ncbi:MAG: RsmB/NOP family class I SAM-dependent RNA methyltransferase [Stappiaceae bacterium]
MKDGGRLAAAIEVLTDIEERHRPAQDALRDWGLSHRFAGSGDRTAIGNLVFDAMRRRLSVSWQMDADTPRARVLGTYCHTWQMGLEKLQKTLTDDSHAPEGLSDLEKKVLGKNLSDSAPEHIQADVPEWIWPSFVANFEGSAIEEGRALAQRAPIDMRVNTLKSTREKLLKRLSSTDVQATPISSVGMRIAPRPGGSKMPHVQAEEGFRKGWFELQDESSQIASQLVFARPGEQVLDYCAGGGGKTLALAADMENRGQLYAYDADKRRLAPIHERIARSGARNIQVRSPRDNALEDLMGKMDRVLVDAPCTGTGVWRRRPDAKWRLTQKALEDRLSEQETAITSAASFVRKGGYLVYATCSVLPEENEQQVYSFIEENPEFEIISLGEVWQDRFGFDTAKPWSADMLSITMTPASTNTDGFFLAVMIRND